MPYSIPAAVTPSELVAMAARRRKAHISNRKADKARAELGLPPLKVLLESSCDVVSTGIPVPTWTPKKRR